MIRQTKADWRCCMNSPGSGRNSQGFGKHSRSFGKDSRAFGKHSRASGRDSRGFGKHSQASGKHSGAFGRDSHASGRNSRGSGRNPYAHGRKSKSSGKLPYHRAILPKAWEIPNHPGSRLIFLQGESSEPSGLLISGRLSPSRGHARLFPSQATPTSVGPQLKPGNACYSGLPPSTLF